MPFKLAFSEQRVGGVGSIVGGQGENLSLPGRAADGSVLPGLDDSDVIASAGDLLVMVFCAARLTLGEGVDIDGNLLPPDERDWTEFLSYPNGGAPANASAVATILTDDFRPVPIEYGGGGLGFLDEGYALLIYRGVKAIIGNDVETTPWPDEISFQGSILAHPFDVTPQTKLAMLGAIGHRNGGSVVGFPTPDQDGDWPSDQLVFPGFNSARLVRWVAPGVGYHWQEHAPPGNSNWIPEGNFLGSGTLPTMTVGVLYLDIESDPEVTRQYPRDDGYGLIGGPRLYPPQRRGRVFGGQQ